MPACTYLVRAWKATETGSEYLSSPIMIHPVLGMKMNRIDSYRLSLIIVLLYVAVYPDLIAILLTMPNFTPPPRFHMMHLKLVCYSSSVLSPFLVEGHSRSIAFTTE